MWFRIATNQISVLVSYILNDNWKTYNLLEVPSLRYYTAHFIVLFFVPNQNCIIFFSVKNFLNYVVQLKKITDWKLKLKKEENLNEIEGTSIQFLLKDLRTCFAALFRRGRRGYKLYKQNFCKKKKIITKTQEITKTHGFSRESTVKSESLS